MLSDSIVSKILLICGFIITLLFFAFSIKSLTSCSVAPTNSNEPISSASSSTSLDEDFKGKLNLKDCYELNVEGKIFLTTNTTLCKFPDSILCPKTNVEYKKQSIYFDRNSNCFPIILSFLRQDNIQTVPYLSPLCGIEQLVQEALYFRLDYLVQLLGRKDYESDISGDFEFHTQKVGSNNLRYRSDLIEEKPLLPPGIFSYLGKRFNTYDSWNMDTFNAYAPSSIKGVDFPYALHDSLLKSSVPRGSQFSIQLPQHYVKIKKIVFQMSGNVLVYGSGTIVSLSGQSNGGVRILKENTMKEIDGDITAQVNDGTGWVRRASEKFAKDLSKRIFTFIVNVDSNWYCN
eukprot:Awhi_evm1s15661